MFNSPNAEQRFSSIRETISSCVVDCCANDVNSFGGIYNQYWRSINNNPAISIATDPEASGGFFLGSHLTVTANDPTYVGNYGQAGGHFLLDGGDYFTYAGYNTSLALTGYAKDWHKTTGGKDFSFLIDVYLSSIALQSIFNTKATGANIGLSFFINGSGGLTLTQRGDTNQVSISSANVLTAGQNYVLGVGHKHSTNETSMIILGDSSTLVNASASHTFNATTTACTTPLFVGVSFDVTITTGSLTLANGTKVRGISMYNEMLSLADLLSAANIMKARR